MRLVSWTSNATPPIAQFEVSGLTDVVVLAGPNGVGKTSLLTALLSFFQNPRANPRIRLVVQATNAAEREAFSGDAVDTADAAQAGRLSTLLQRPKKRGKLRSGVLNFDTSRAFQNIEPYAWSFNFADPFEEDIGWNQTFQPARGRFQDVIHSLLRKLRSQKESISERALAMQKAGETSMLLDFPDPLEKFKRAFTSLLPGKSLLDLDEQSQQVRYQTAAGTILPLTSLSSGEREVVTIVFDFLLRDPQDSIVVFDEPELHLHPELSYRLLRTLRESGERNQFIYCTHSPDIITASLEQTVVFIAPVREPPVNQAVAVQEDDGTSSVLQMLGQSIGVISLGKRLVLIEGDRNSLDKQTYGAITGSSHSDLVLVPAGGKGTIATFVAALDGVLNKTLWGVEWFMLADGDAAAGVANPGELEKKAAGRLKLLPRYHLENYFLDEYLLADVFAYLEHPGDSWQRDPKKVRAELRALARPLVSYGTALKVAHMVRFRAGNIDVMPKNCHGIDHGLLAGLFEARRAAEHERMAQILDAASLSSIVETQFKALDAAVENDDDNWKILLPGKSILKNFATKSGQDVSTLKRLYIKLARTGARAPFADIEAIFTHFSQFGH